MKAVFKAVLLGIALAMLGVFLAACQKSDLGPGDFTITVAVDGDRLVYRYDKAISVGQFLQEIGITLGEYDEVNPLTQTQLRDGMRITITRVVQRQECENQDLPYEKVTQPSQNVAPNETQLGQTGENGIVQECYRIVEKDGVETSRDKISSVVIKRPRDEIIYVGAEPPETLVPIEGVLTFILGGQAWVIVGNTANLNPLSEDNQLDGRVFDLSEDGLRLLYTRRTTDPNDPEFSNELWAVLGATSQSPQPVQLDPEDVRVAEWVPGQPYAVSYSTADPVSGGGWRAYNDLYVMQIDPETGESLADGFQELILTNSLGSYSYWGRRLVWSPDGTQLAWSNADSVGLVDLEKGDFITLMSFPEYRPLLELYQGASVWTPTLSWSEDGHLITIVHGPPYADEAPADSIIFNMAVVDVENDIQIDPFKLRTGIWSCPTYSPVISQPDGTFDYSIAYFLAREPLNSPGTQYDLVVADRDGSNDRVVFPGSGRTGLRPDPEDGIAWSPFGRQIALIYQGNLWIVDVKSGQAYQITSDGQASRPRWSRIR